MATGYKAQVDGRVHRVVIGHEKTLEFIGVACSEHVIVREPRVLPPVQTSPLTCVCVRIPVGRVQHAIEFDGKR